MRRDYEFTVYRGTFIQLGRLPEPDQTSSPAKPELQRTQGVLWVSAESGRVKGFDWKTVDDEAFTGFMSRHGWVDVDGKTNGNLGGATKVKIVEAREDRNEFFFPGFIGEYMQRGNSLSQMGDMIILADNYRYTYPCTSIPKCRSLRLLNSSRLVRDIHIPSRIWIRHSANNQGQTPSPTTN